MVIGQEKHFSYACKSDILLPVISRSFSFCSAPCPSVFLYAHDFFCRFAYVLHPKRTLRIPFLHQKKSPKRFFQAVDKPYKKVSEGHYAPLAEFVSTGYAGRVEWFHPKAKPFLPFFTAVSFADSEKCKLDKAAKPLCRHTERTLKGSSPAVNRL